MSPSIVSYDLDAPTLALARLQIETIPEAPLLTKTSPNSVAHSAGLRMALGSLQKWLLRTAEWVAGSGKASSIIRSFKTHLRGELQHYKVWELFL